LLEAKPDSKTRLVDTKVGYLHRSVKDYLERKETSARLHAVSRADFNVNLRLYNTQIMRLKRQFPETLEDKLLWERVTYAIEYAVRADPNCSGLQVALLNEVDKVAVALTTTCLADGSTYLQRTSMGLGVIATHWTWTRIDCRERGFFLGLAVQCQLVDYVDQTLRSMTSQQASKAASRLTDLALNHNSVFTNEYDRPVVYQHGVNHELLNLLRGYKDLYQKEMSIELVPERHKFRGRLLSCFCFG
jgi:hypothetical protein